MKLSPLGEIIEKGYWVRQPTALDSLIDGAERLTRAAPDGFQGRQSPDYSVFFLAFAPFDPTV